MNYEKNFECFQNNNNISIEFLQFTTKIVLTLEMCLPKRFGVMVTTLNDNCKNHYYSFAKIAIVL